MEEFGNFVPIMDDDRHSISKIEKEGGVQMEYARNECEQIGKEYYFQNQTGNISEIKCPSPGCKDGVVIFGIQEEGETFYELHKDTLFEGLQILHFHCDSCNRIGRFPNY